MDTLPTEVHLSEAEMDIIADKVCDRLQHKLYLNIGSGVVAMFWRGLITIMIGIAAYGFSSHFFK